MKPEPKLSYAQLRQILCLTISNGTLKAKLEDFLSGKIARINEVELLELISASEVDKELITILSGHHPDEMDAIIGWIGGKRILRKTISQYVPKNITGFIEPFGGAAWMLLYKEKWGDLEVYNDLDNRLVNLFMQVKYHPDELIRELDWLVASRKLFGDILKQEGFTESRSSVINDNLYSIL